MAFKLTPEQEYGIKMFKTTEDGVITAGAGAGKTSELEACARSTKRRGIYVAYNASMKAEAQTRFPKGLVRCSTSHGLAFSTIGKNYADRLFKSPRMSGRQWANILGIKNDVSFGDKLIKPGAMGAFVKSAITRFCYSADEKIDWWHAPIVDGVEGGDLRDLREMVANIAQVAWDRYLTPLNGPLKFEHDHYLKMFQLTKPTIYADYFAVDEAQDTNPCVEDIMLNQRDHAQIIMVGDSAQQIYAWRGAEDAMSRFDAHWRAKLTKSFRFGPAVAAEANKFLDLLNAEIRIEGFDQIESVVTQLDECDAILCRTNAEAIAQAIGVADSGKAYALLGGTDEIKSFAWAAEKLMQGVRVDHPDLAAFKDWGELKEYVTEDEGGSDLKVKVKLVDDYGPAMIVDIAERAVPENKADTTISTAHKAKGREWDRVKIGTDFFMPEEGKEPNRAELMLAYVSVTRAQKALDIGSLGWVDDYIASNKEVSIAE